MEYPVAVVGATGNVGKKILDILAERKFPASEVTVFSSSQSAGRTIRYGTQTLDCVRLETDSLQSHMQNKIVFFATTADVARKYTSIAARSRCIIIDNSSLHRYEEDIPLVVPEVNAEKIADYVNQGIIASPNASTIQMMVALKPLHDYATIRRVVVSTYQSSSGDGNGSMLGLMSKLAVDNRNNNSEHVAFNLIPQIGHISDKGHTDEEWRIVQESKKIMGISVSATCVKVPTYVGHGAALNIEFESPISAAKARQLLENALGVELAKKDKYTTPIGCTGKDPVFVSRIREDETLENGLSLWCVADNLRKGAALNAVQIAEHLVKNHLE